MNEIESKLLSDAVAVASGNIGAMESVASLYRSVQHEIDERRPVCVISGRCCKFEEFGHRLYVSTIELAVFVKELKEQNRPSAWDGTGCPFQRNKLCSVHQIRPFGCRMFFCDATSTEWQNAAYERFHAELKHLHEEFSIPYFYVEWREALQALKVTTDALRNEM